MQLHLLPKGKDFSFTAIDFETANKYPDSACAVGLVRVECGQAVRKTSILIKPPQDEFSFTWVHGITLEDVAHSPDFKGVWPAMEPFFRGVDFLAAHNASFDERVLRQCCRTFGIQKPALPFLCTVKLARKVWNIHPTRLPNVCQFLKIDLRHHNALSDAAACAGIVIKAMEMAKD